MFKLAKFYGRDWRNVNGAVMETTVVDRLWTRRAVARQPTSLPGPQHYPIELHCEIGAGNSVGLSVGRITS